MLDLVQEMEIMKMIGNHENVLSLLHCCTQDGPLYVIVEYAPHGNLRDFLRQYRPAPKNESDIDEGYGDYQTLTQTQLTIFAYQIAKGMEYLALKRVSKAVNLWIIIQILLSFSVANKNNNIR